MMDWIKSPLYRAMSYCLGDYSYIVKICSTQTHIPLSDSYSSSIILLDCQRSQEILLRQLVCNLYTIKKYRYNITLQQNCNFTPSKEIVTIVMIFSASYLLAGIEYCNASRSTSPRFGFDSRLFLFSFVHAR